MLKNLPLNHVKLKDNVFNHRRDLVKKYISDFDTNRLMHNFRINAGLSSNDKPLGGWEAPQCKLRGHFTGHFLSACAKMAYADSDRFLYEKANEIVSIMQSCAKPSGYLSAFEEAELDILEAEENRNVWAPYYTLHKIMQGLLDSYLLLKNEEALNLAVNLGLYIYRRFEKLSFWKIDGILRCTKTNPVNEYGGIGDSFYTLYEITKNERILSLAKLFDRDYFIANLKNGTDILCDLHTNTHLPMVISAIHCYDILQDEEYRTAVLNFYDYLSERTFANGNSSSKAQNPAGNTSEKSEHWGLAGKLDDALTGGESESCCAHNTEKILEYLLKRDNSVNYLNHLEILKYNAVLNSASSKTGLSQYSQPMGANAVKQFSSNDDSFWCCTGSGIEALSEMQKNIWFYYGNTIMLNAYISSETYYEDLGVTISQKSSYPDELSSVLNIYTDKPAEFKLMLKADTVKSLSLNGVSCDLRQENGFIVLQQLFNNNDKIHIDVNASLRLVPLKSNNNLAAVMFGNILLAQIGGLQDLYGFTNENINQKLMRCDGEELKFAFADNLKNEIRFVPLYRVEDEIYSVYLPV